MDTPTLQKVPPYQVLASIYDAVMSHVDYRGWADYLNYVVERFAFSTEHLHELGCGTGNLTFALWYSGRYGNVSGSDQSPAMIQRAREKARRRRTPLEFYVMDFHTPHLTEQADVIVLVYDGINYLLTETAVLHTLQRLYPFIRPGGLFIFDTSTPANSLNNAGLFEDIGRVGGIHYVRRSAYDPASHLHRTWFLIEHQGQRYLEEHVERAYTMEEMQALIEQTPFDLEAAYHELTTRPATPHSERVHWILRRPKDDLTV